MALYAVGDLQGCLDPLERLLERVRFDPSRDRLWLVGDLVNRGPDSAGCLRRVRSLGAAATTVLGNHDLHLLAASEGLREPGRRDTLQEVLNAPDAAELLEWVASQPLLHRDPDSDWTLVHAGIPPVWDTDTAAAEARRVEAELGEPRRRRALLEVMYGDTPAQWDPALQGYDRLRFAINGFTRMRMVGGGPGGALEFASNGPPEEAPATLVPWFEHPARRSRGTPVVFGHWAALGHRRGPDWLALDSGCVWGNAMSLARLDGATPQTAAVEQVSCPGT